MAGQPDLVPGNVEHPDLATQFPYFHPAVAAWFRETFEEPSPPQALGWPLIAGGKNVLLLAPTGSGKTLAAFLQCLNWLYQRAQAGDQLDGSVQVLYISPLKALNNDIYRNMEIPLEGIARTAEQMGLTLPRLRSAVRTGDTPASERQAILKHPPHILITTPESLFLMLCSKARRILAGVRFVIVDEIHALFPTKRGVHLSLSLECLEELVGPRSFQRIGLSATQRPLDEVAAFLGGGTLDAELRWAPRPVEIVDTGQRKKLDLRIQLPVPDLRALPEKSIWPEIYKQLLGLVQEHRSTLIFVNNRAVAERVTAKINELAGEGIARVHHGSVSREIRFEVESLLKSGELRCLVATSSLELGIDVGSIDLVVQVESPHEVARGLQRVGRAGHLVGMPSKGRMIPKTRADLLEAAAISREMGGGRIERSHAPRNCLDVLAQHLVGLTVDRSAPAEDLFRLVRRAYGYRGLSRDEFDRVLAMLSGQFGADEFVELRPRLFWDRVNGLVRASEGGKHLVYTNSGTIPDRGYFGVYMEGSPVRLGELDEEFVFERRLGDRFVLGTNTWQIEEIRQDRVVVVPAGGAPTVPFWRGEGVGRPYELGCTIGRFMEEVAGRLDDPDLPGWLEKECLMDAGGAKNLRQYLLDQREATGVLPSHRCLVVEEFPDELGEWRVMIHSPFGQRVNTPLAMLLADQLRQRQGLEVEGVRSDDGILFLCPAAPGPPFFDPAVLEAGDLEGRIAELVSTMPLFGLLFRHNAARALILPRGAHGGKRTPLWLSRVKAADLLQVVASYPSFPIVIETYREILSEVFDLDGLREVITGLRTGAIQVQRCRRAQPSPFAHPLAFDLVAVYMYEQDLPKAERRLHSLSLDREVLKNLLGKAELRRLLDPEAIRQVAEDARGLSAKQRPRSPDEWHAWLLKHGELEIGARGAGSAENAESAGSGSSANLTRKNGFWQEEGLLEGEKLKTLRDAGRIVRITWSSGERTVEAWIAAENLPEYQAALGERLKYQLPGRDSARDASFPSPQEAVDSLLRRFARTRGPFHVHDLVQRYGFAQEEVQGSLARLETAGLVQAGEFLPGGIGTEWCDVSLLQRMHRRSLARARREVAPRSPEDYCAFLARWHGIGSPGSGLEGLSHALERLGGVFLPAALWEGGVLPVRVRDYQPVLLDQLISSGLFTWIGEGTGDGLRVAFYPAGADPVRRGPPGSDGRAGGGPPGGRPAGDGAGGDAVSASVMPQVGEDELAGARSQIAGALLGKGALSLPQLWQQTGLPVEIVLAALEEMIGQGRVTNDTFGPVRYLLSRSSKGRNATRGTPRSTARSAVRGVVRGVVRGAVHSAPRSASRSISPAVLAQMGRWSLVGNAPGSVTPKILCQDLLSRYGIVTRDVVAGEGLPWSLVSQTFTEWEIVGKVRRGYFVDGLAGIQYAKAEAVEGLRLPPDAGLPEFWGLAAQDPANPLGSILPWPGMERSPARPEVVVFRAGTPILAAEGRRVRLFSLGLPVSWAEEKLAAALKELIRVLGFSRRGDRRTEIVEWDGKPIVETVAGEILAGLGFERGYKAMVKWGS
ncbi:MAG: DEAD/DEAH box helicase [Firmicutes bacterium]|nr:DEAD/DEAH box helicase [Bacillota bacterium]